MEADTGQAATALLTEHLQYTPLVKHPPIARIVHTYLVTVTHR